MARKLFFHGQTMGKQDWRKRALLNLLAALSAVALFTCSMLVLRTHIPLGIILFFYLFLVFGLVYSVGMVPAIAAACVMFLVLDYLGVSPAGSFMIAHSQDAWGILICLIFALLLCLAIAHQRKHIENVRRQKEEDRLRFQEQLHVQSEEISRRNQQMSIFYNVMQATRNEKDLRVQLALIAQTIDEAFGVYGIHDCLFLLSGVDDRPFVNTVNAQFFDTPLLSADEKASMMRVIQQAQPAMILDAPIVFHEKGSYVRRIVGRNSSGSPEVYRYIYMVPLISGRRVLGELGQKVLGVMRLLVEDDGNLELHSLKKVLDMPTGSSTLTAEPALFPKLLDHAVFLIEQTLIERGLMRQESMNKVLQRRAEEVKSAILSSVSHDFHTPLTMIIGAASGLLNPETCMLEKEEHRQMLRDIVSEANWLERSVMKMLDLSRLEQGALMIEKELYPFDEIYQNTLELGHMRSLVKGRHILLDIPNDLPPVEVDPDLIEHVMVNLIENAIHHSLETTAIEVSAREKNSHMVVTVADRGTGIPPAELEPIFDRFHRVTVSTDGYPSLPQHQGSGLGLAICRGYVQAHGGHIWAENREGGGAKFMFTLPLLPPSLPTEGADIRYEENPRR